MKKNLEGAVRYLVEKIDEFETIQIETNRCLPESDHALYMKYLSELEEIGFTLIELYVRYLQKVCYDDTTNILMGNLNIDQLNEEIEEDPNDLLETTLNNKDKKEELNELNKLNKLNNNLPKREIFDRKRLIWQSQYPNILREIPSWLTQLLQKVQSELFTPIKINEKEEKEEKEKEVDSEGDGEY